jgi:hypothetical protein
MSALRPLLPIRSAALSDRYAPVADVQAAAWFLKAGVHSGGGAKSALFLSNDLYQSLRPCARNDWDDAFEGDAGTWSIGRSPVSTCVEALEQEVQLLLHGVATLSRCA